MGTHPGNALRRAAATAAFLTVLAVGTVSPAAAAVLEEPESSEAKKGWCNGNILSCFYKPLGVIADAAWLFEIATTPGKPCPPRAKSGLKIPEPLMSHQVLVDRCGNLVRR